jgi:hypothetical protein
MLNEEKRRYASGIITVLIKWVEANSTWDK